VSKRDLLGLPNGFEAFRQRIREMTQSRTSGESSDFRQHY